MPKSRFRIIAMRPITPEHVDDDTLNRVKSIQKKVYGMGWLYFYEGYHLTDVPNAVAGDDDMLPFYGFQLEVPDHANEDGLLFDTENIAVSVGAIVGRNGSGKSSAVELMIRILNNLSVAAKGEKKNHLASEHLFYIEDVYGSIVAVIDNLYFQIQVYGRSVKIGSYKWNEDNQCFMCESPLDMLSLLDKEDRFRPIEGNGLGMLQLVKLFYTAIFNYSMYSYNFHDYFAERTKENRWLGKDEKGNWKKEYFTGDYSEDQCWLKGLFHKNDGYQTPIVLSPMREKGIINVPKENNLSRERVRNMLFYEGNSMGGHGGQPQFPFRLVNGHLEVVALKVSKIENPKFGKALVLKTLNLEGTPIAGCFDEIRDILCNQWSKLMCMGYLEDTEHESLAWDYVIYKTLKIITTYDKYGDAAKDIIFFQTIDKAKIKTHLHSLFLDDSHVTLKLRQALNFLKFKVFRGYIGEYISLFDAFERYKAQLDVFAQMNLNFDEETGVLTSNVPTGYNESDLPSFDYDAETGALVISYDETNEKPIPLFYVDDEGSFIARFPNHQEILPPPIFNMELLLIEKDKIKKNGDFSVEETFPMSGLSSGERQVAGAVSYFAYHLANIDSVWKDKNLKVLAKTQKAISTDDNRFLFKYKYVNVVFDEVELYFHPDLQRMFMRHLMETIRNLHLEHIEGLNILLVTHSPFVLSDLPRSNVLALGDEEDDIKETFCANIHEMLGNSFFMEYTTGDLAREQVEEIFNLYNEFSMSKDKHILISKKVKSWPRFEYVAEHVADEYLHGLVGRMMDEMSRFLPVDNLDEEIQKAEEHLKELKARKGMPYD